MADGWIVTGTRQVSEMQMDGRFSDSIEVNYVTDDGHHGTVRVPKRSFTPAAVHERIAEEVAKIAAIHRL